MSSPWMILSTASHRPYPKPCGAIANNRAEWDACLTRRSPSREVVSSPRDEEPSGRIVLRLIQIRLATPSFEKISTASQGNSATPNRRFEFHKRSQLFIRVHNETLSVVAMRVCNPNCSPVGINRCDAAPTPTGLLSFSEDLPVPPAA
jgi:hypothetical protein